MSASPRARLPAGWQAPSDYLRERVVLVSGAAGGLGRASALACARAGASVVLLGRRVARLEKVYDEIVALQAPRPAIYPLDLAGATPRDYAELAATLERELGRLDGIVHAAAHFESLQPAADIEADEWLRGIHVNVSAPFLLTQACLPLLRVAAQASVVFVLDDPERMSRAYWGAYGVAKHALAGLVSILRAEWESTFVRAHALLPAPMRTRLRGAAYYGENALDLPLPDATADAVVYLLGADGATAQTTLDLR
ncbi:MAG: SDR family NAD(P)-dependent oxidoreductase [Xanthomonadaceae bacterium]|nr:SDR family NAD(P)-dependent oxidoreductase [Xanthomonadaceae bacterium]MDE2084863.1 SDR family NAD(P)-dependent oxidoreductase [Xanthomonadaceae bacterium]MDE2257479.1 SDR family NAD(P)-dependent oxidoreductase [Xanthomonadaceae bacterium]